MAQGMIHANLPSRDYDVTAAFYERLGFDVTYRGDNWMARCGCFAYMIPTGHCGVFYNWKAENEQ